MNGATFEFNEKGVAFGVLADYKDILVFRRDRIGVIPDKEEGPDERHDAL